MAGAGGPALGAAFAAGGPYNPYVNPIRVRPGWRELGGPALGADFAAGDLACLRSPEEPPALALAASFFLAFCRARAVVDSTAVGTLATWVLASWVIGAG